MRQQTPRSRRSRVAQVLSTILFVAASGFAAAAVYLWYTGDDNDGPNPPPTAEHGEAELANVLTVLQNEEPEWDYGSSGSTTVRSDQLDPPGQLLKLGDTSLYVFIFVEDTPQSITAREQAADAANPDTMVLTTPSGQVVHEGQPLSMAEASNVITILVGGDQALTDQVQASLANLP